MVPWSKTPGATKEKRSFALPHLCGRDGHKLVLR